MATTETTALSVEPREPGGSREARRLRRTGKVPGVVYGGGEDTFAFQVDARVLRQALAHHGAVLELRIDGDGKTILDRLRAEGLLDEYAFAVGSTLTLPLREMPGNELLLKVEALGIKTSAVTTRPPTLDDVYLRLTGGRLAPGAQE